MLKRTLKFVLSNIALIIWQINTAFATTYYENNFDSGTAPKYFPDTEIGQIWTLARAFPDVYGEGNHFTLSTSSSHSGGFSLRFTYEARNGFCNTCGTYFTTHLSGLDNSTFFVADNGEDLTLPEDTSTTKANDGPAAQPGRLVYNNDNGHSQWIIKSVDNQITSNDKLTVSLQKAGINGETPEFNSGDTVAIARHCGVDGHVAGKVDRRSDCDKVIIWFSYVEPQLPGASIFRRQYLKAEVTSPGVRQKLHYLRPDRGGSLQGEVVLFGQTSLDDVIELELTGLDDYGTAQSIYSPDTAAEFVDLEFKRGTWYYIQEQYKAATLNPGYNASTDPDIEQYNADGEYRLWFSESGMEPLENNPTLELTALRLPPIAGGSGTHISFWGNTQHKTHNRGSWYIDDVLITDTFNSPVFKNGAADVLPPKTPVTSKN